MEYCASPTDNFSKSASNWKNDTKNNKNSYDNTVKWQITINKHI